MVCLSFLLLFAGCSTSNDGARSYPAQGGGGCGVTEGPEPADDLPPYREALHERF